MEADEAPPFNMMKFLQDAQADRAAQAAQASAVEQEVEQPAFWENMTTKQKKHWKIRHRKKNK
jgi:hypothetical protein